MHSATAPSPPAAAAQSRLWPYVPTLVADWLRDRPAERYQALDCTLVFADVSGFTRLTELLGSRGKIGAEEMAEVINGTFEQLLAPAYRYGAGLVKWGGDATLLHFEGPGHVVRACRSAHEMQQVMRRIGGLRTGRGAVRLRMSIGVHAGVCDAFLVGAEDHRELVLTGPAATALTRMEKVAGPGQIVVSDATADALARAGERRPMTAIADGWLLARPPAADPDPDGLAPVDYSGIDVGAALCRALREHILGGAEDSEHREATVGFLKFSGLDAALAGQEPAAVADALDHVIATTQAAAERHGVTFLATDVGADGGKLMLSAGAPRSLGHDADRMLATLRAVLDAAGRLPLRAGVTTGRAFTGDFGPSFRRTYSLMGDCVNLAARLMEHAPDGELLASGEVLDAVHGNVAAVARAPFAAKGKRAPVRAFAIGSLGDRAGESAPVAPSAPDPLVGRESELEILMAAARQAAAGDGVVVEVLGEPGMGKSRLLSELAARSTADVLWATGDVYAGTRPYAPFERLLRERWQVPDGAPPEAFAERLQATTEAHAPQLLPWLPLIGLVAGLELPETTEVAQTEPTLRKQRLEEATSELLGTVLHGPTVLVFNDVHLMDDASRELIARLGADAPERPWLVIASRRPDGDGAFDPAPPQTIELGPLSPAAASELLRRATARAPLPAHRLAALARRAAGNPLFLRELVAQLAAGGSPDQLPRSVEGAIAARIDRLRPTDRQTLRCAAVLGMEVDAEVLGEVLQAAAGPDDRVAGLAEFLDPVGPRRWRFSHQLVREVAYDGLPYRRRTELHSRTAEAIARRTGGHPEQQAELLSVHLFAGARYADAWRYARLAAQRARSRYANAEAADSYRLALDAAGHVDALPNGELASVDEALGEIFVELGELEAADVALRRALRRFRDEPLAAARLELQVARLRDISGRHDLAMQWAARAERNLAGLDGPEVCRLRARLAARRARIAYRRGRPADGLAFAGAAAELARESGDRPTLAEALEYGDLCAIELGRPAGAGAEQAMAIYEELGALAAQARVRNTLGMVAYHRGLWSEALEHYRIAQDAYERAGYGWDSTTCGANAAEILTDQGRLDEAEAEFERAMHVWRGARAASEVAFGDYQLGRIAARRGDAATALVHFAAAREHLQAAGELTEVVLVDALTAECHWLAGEPAEALSLARAALARAQALGGVGLATPLLGRIIGSALLALGDRPAGAASLRAALDSARAREAAHEVAAILAALVAGEVASSAEEAGAWLQERSRLEAQLGITPAPSPGGRVHRT